MLTFFKGLAGVGIIAVIAWAGWGILDLLAHSAVGNAVTKSGHVLLWGWVDWVAVVPLIAFGLFMIWAFGMALYVKMFEDD